MKRKLARFILLIIVLAVTGFYLVQVGAQGVVFDQEDQLPQIILDLQSPDQQATQAARATATYGAQQFYLQLTAVADDQ